MQLLSSSSTKLETSPLIKILQDIADNVELRPNFCVCHPRYKPLELPAEVVARFQHVPSELQQKYLNLQLQSFLYGIYYNGSLRSSLALNSDKTSPVNHQNLENNTFLGVDLQFYDRLHESNCGAGYFEPGWQILRQESDGSLAVTRGGLTLHIERERHLHPSEHAATKGDFVAVRMPRNLMQNGFYVAVGNAGNDHGNAADADSTIVRIYFNLTPEGAIAVMANLTQQLNDQAIPFTFKVLYNPADYDRYDSGVLYFAKKYYPIVRPILHRVYAAHHTAFLPDVPLFTNRLEAGLALAEEPDRKFAAQESFGMNRCQIIANGLLATKDASSEARFAAILESFAIAEIDLDKPFLNPSSQDIYNA